MRAKIQKEMTPHDKVMYIINQLELSDRKVSEVVGKSVSAVTHRRSGVRAARFSEEDYERLSDYYIEKLRRVEYLRHTCRLKDLPKERIGGKEYIVIYKAYQALIEEERIEDAAYFLREEDAREYANGIKLNVGFSLSLEKDFIDIDSVEDIEYEEELLEVELIEYLSECEVYDREVTELIVYNGKDITGAIVIEWSYERYVGYCRNLLNIGIAGEGYFYDLKKESNLITGNEDSTYKSNYSVLIPADRVAALVKEGNLSEEVIYDALYDNQWRWNDTKHNPYNNGIRTTIGEIVVQLSK